MELKKKETFASIGFLILVPLITHVLFSPLGFNPTDDGFTLAYSRRILEGQIPHRDFIIIRPFLSPLIHTPIVLFGGDYTYLLSRYIVWFQFAFISWTWVSLLEKWVVKQPFLPVEKISMALISFAASAHTFPIMAWHTIDGLFLMAIGLVFCMAESPSKKTLGYFIIGLAYLCKQSFIFLAPGTIFILGDWKKIKYWLAILMPGLLYVLFLSLTQALPDAFVQLLSLKNSFFSVIACYLNWVTFSGAIISAFSAHLIAGKENQKSLIKTDTKKFVGLLLLSFIPMMITSMSFFYPILMVAVSFGIFGMVLGVVLYFIIKQYDNFKNEIQIFLIVLLMAWCSSISLGVNNPILVLGQMLVSLFAFTYPYFKRLLRELSDKPIYAASLACLTVTIFLSFTSARFHIIYREQDSSKLTYSVDSVLPGGKGIRTNGNTYSFLYDMNRAIRISREMGKGYVILPDCAGYWVKSPESNPLSIDWALSNELSSPELINRVNNEIEMLRNKDIFIVQKVKADYLADEFYPMGTGNAVVNYVRDNFSKIRETSYFELYQ